MMTFSNLFFRPITAVMAVLLMALTFASAPVFSDNKPASPEIKLYLKDGKQINGHLAKLEDNMLHLRAGKDTVLVPLSNYQGLVLNTKEEIKVGYLISNNMDAFLEAVQYTLKVRQSLDKKLDKKLTCKSSQKPFAHFSVNREGKVQNLALLTKSGCNAVNQAIRQAIETTAFPPLSRYYPHELYVVNYFPGNSPAPANTSNAKKP